MKKAVLFFAVMVLGCGAVWAQGPPPKSLDSGVPPIPTAQSANLAAGTVISGKLDNQLDLSQAKVGDQVVLRTDQAVIFDQSVIAKKGSRLIGHVAEVHQRANGEAESSLGIVFDRLESGTTQIPLSASITSVLRPSANANVNNGMGDSDLGADSSNGVMIQRAPAGGGTSSTGTLGGITGGVTGTVGSLGNTGTGAVNGITDTATRPSGGVISATGENVGNTVRATGTTNISGLHIVPLTSGELRGGSSLTIASGNLQLEKGTTIVVLVD